jgi:uncharacterized protein (DUF58 family)
VKPKYRFNIQPKHPPRQAMAGDWSGLDKGTGYEFWGLRRYVPGDSFGHIDWKARARSGELHVREFLKDSAYNLMLICDVSPSMQFGGKLALAREVAVSLAHAALRGNNPCGLLLFSDRVHAFHPPSAAPRQFHRIVGRLQDIRPRPCRRTLLRPALELVMKRLPSCLGIILSDFHADMGDLPGILEAATRHFPAHEMVALQILEEVEHDLTSLGDGLVTVRDMESGREAVLDLARRRSYNAVLRLERERTRSALAGAGIDAVVLPVGAGDIQQRVNTLFARRLAARV